MVTTKSSSLQKGCPTYLKRCDSLKDFEISLQRPFMLTCSPIIYKEHLTEIILPLIFMKNVCVCVQKYRTMISNEQEMLHLLQRVVTKNQRNKKSLKIFNESMGLSYFSQNLKGEYRTMFTFS